MALIKRIVSRGRSCYVVHANEQTFLLDYPSSVYGACISYPSFDKSSRPLKLALPRLTDDIDYVLITRSDSLGVLFMQKDVPIYMTEPVFEQILMNYQSILNLRLHYEEDGDDGVLVTSADIARFRRNVRLIRFDEICRFNQVRVIPRSAGTFIGWASYLIELENRKTLCYVSSLSSKKRFSLDAGSISSDYLIVNTDKQPDIHEIDAFSDCIKCLETDIAVIPVDLTTLLLEVVFHVLSLLHLKDSIPVYIVYPLFDRFYTTVGIQNDWLNKSFSSIKDPFPIKAYKRLHVLTTIDKLATISGPAVVFCSPLEFSLYPQGVFETQKVVSINRVLDQADMHYGLRLELDLEEITSMHTGTIIHDTAPNRYLYIDTTCRYFYLSIDGCKTQVYANEMYVHGKLRFSDRQTATETKMELVQDKCKITDLFANEPFFFNNGLYYFPRKNLKIEISRNRVRIENISK
ncbi:putative beta-lactamase-like protein [Ordospora pajunii]|uniref:putative beta-lactamase-like protein n=1 Tax=Ordospora pajunii TaxID=3039483 RepID=UPI0029527E0F|nr:putative beta-lactamase-like protein [Ordospora pajunii]KAH9412054.1 putative beta-lactamase-like protein [Ordospora pajunii]